MPVSGRGPEQPWKRGERNMVRAAKSKIAKKAKNFAEGDRIRDELKAQGIEVTDVPGGAKWKRV